MDCALDEKHRHKRITIKDAIEGDFNKLSRLGESFKILHYAVSDFYQLQSLIMYLENE